MMTRRTAHLLAVATTFFLGACESVPFLRAQTKVETSEEVANVFVSAYPAIAWSDIRERLEPKHNLTTEQARGMAANVTQVEYAQFISTLAAGLGLGLATNTQTTTTTLRPDGTRSTEGTQVRSTGAVPGSSGSTHTAPTEAALAANLAAGPMAVGMDASTLLTVGTAVYQQAQILDAQISKAIEPKGYKAYVVTFQINLQPKRRDLAYDTYVNISMIPGSWQEAIRTADKVHDAADGLPPVMVFPLIITDAMEAASVGRSIEVMRSVALQLSGMVGRVGANAGLSGASDRLESLVGMEKNSLVTVGRVTDHTLRVRLGAQYGGKGATMVPRTHNISAVILTRWDEDPQRRVKSLSVFTDATHHALDGGRLPSGRMRAPEELAARVARSVWRYGFGEVREACAPVPDSISGPPAIVKERFPELAVRKAGITKYLDLLRAVDRADYAHVETCLGLDKNLHLQRDLTLRRLLAELIEIQSESRYSKLQVSLRDYPDPTHPRAGQLGLLLDDPKTAATIVLRDGKGLTPQNVGAELKLKGGAKVLLAESISVKDGAEIEVKFPSLAKLGLQLSDLDPEPLNLTINKKAVAYELRALKVQEKPKGSVVTSTSAILVADAAGVARVTLLVSKVPDGFKAPMRITVAGADVRADTVIGAAANGPKGVVVAAESTVTLLLGNLSSTRPVAITTYDAADKVVGEPLTLGVERIFARSAN